MKLPFKSLYFFALALAFTSTSLWSAESFAQKKSRKYVNLVVGLTQDVKLDNMPASPKFEGNFKKVTRIMYAKEIKTLRFNPKKTGTATLSVLDRKGNVVAELFLTVRKSDLNKIAKEIQSLLRDIGGVEVKIINNKVIVDGEVLLPKDLNRVYSVVAQYGQQASTIVTLSPVAQKKIAEFIERDINNPEIHVRSVNGKFIIEGVANNEAEKQRSEIIAKTYVPDIVVDQAEAEGPDDVHQQQIEHRASPFNRGG